MQNSTEQEFLQKQNMLPVTSFIDFRNYDLKLLKSEDNINIQINEMVRKSITQNVNVLAAYHSLSCSQADDGNYITNCLK